MVSRVVNVKITVPDELNEARQVRYEHKNKEVFIFEIPEGLSSGDSYLQPIRVKSEVEEQRIQIKVPDFLADDRIVEYVHKDGKKFRLKVPEGLKAGDVFIQPLLLPVDFSVPEEHSGGGQILERRGNQVVVRPIIPLPPPSEAVFSAVDIQATVDGLGGVEQARRMQLIHSDDVAVKPMRIEFNNTSQYLKGDHCIASYRWDLQIGPDGREVSRSILFLILKAQRLGYKYLFLDRFAVSQVSTHLVEDVVYFSNLYKFMPAITAYNKIGDLGRCWILSEIATYAPHTPYREIIEVVSPKGRPSGVFALRDTLQALATCGFTGGDEYSNFLYSPFHPFHALPASYRYGWLILEVILAPLKLAVLGPIAIVLTFIGAILGDYVSYPRLVLEDVENVTWALLYFTGLPSLYLNKLLKVDSMTRGGKMRQRSFKPGEAIEDAEKIILIKPLIVALATSRSPCTYYGDAIHVLLTQGLKKSARKLLKSTTEGFVMPGRTLSRGHVSCDLCRVRALVILWVLNGTETDFISLSAGRKTVTGEKIYQPLLDSLERAFDPSMKRTTKALYVFPWGTRIFSLNEFFEQFDSSRTFNARHTFSVATYGSFFFDQSVFEEGERLAADRAALIEWATLDMVTCKCSQQAI